MSEALQHKPFNPTWLTVAAVVLTGVISGSVSTAINSRDISELRARQDTIEAWRNTMDRRFSEEQLATGKTLVALQKDVETANKTLVSIQNALMVRGPGAHAINSTP